MRCRVLIIEKKNGFKSKEKKKTVKEKERENKETEGQRLPD